MKSLAVDDTCCDVFHPAEPNTDVYDNFINHARTLQNYEDPSGPGKVVTMNPTHLVIFGNAMIVLQVSSSSSGSV